MQLARRALGQRFTLLQETTGYRPLAALRRQAALHPQQAIAIGDKGGYHDSGIIVMGCLAALAKPVIARFGAHHVTQQGAAALGAVIDVGQTHAPCAQTCLRLVRSIGAMLFHPRQRRESLTSHVIAGATTRLVSCWVKRASYGGWPHETPITSCTNCCNCSRYRWAPSRDPNSGRSGGPMAMSNAPDLPSAARRSCSVAILSASCCVVYNAVAQLILLWPAR